MRLTEIVLSPLYIVTTRKKKICKVVERAASTYPLGAVREGWLERRRPEGALPREKSLYLQTTPSPNEPFVYLVEPIGQVDRHHSAWLKMLSQANQDIEGEMDHYACAYWSGKERPEDRDEPWEYRALQVRILGRVGDQSGDRSP